MEFSHRPVLFQEAVNALDVQPTGIYVDGTAGGGGHSGEIASRLTSGKLISIDQDPDAIQTLMQRLGGYSCVQVVQANFSQMDHCLLYTSFPCNFILCDHSLGTLFSNPDNCFRFAFGIGNNLRSVCNYSFRLPNIFRQI